MAAPRNPDPPSSSNPGHPGRRQAPRSAPPANSAATDTATGLPNRRALDQLLESGRIRRDRRRSIACTLMGIDDLHAVRMLHGDGGVERMIRSVADEIRSIATAGDTLYRVAEDRFLLLRTGCDVSEAWVWAEHARSRVRDTRITTPLGDVAVTMSIGLHAQSPASFTRDTIELVETALCVARERGGDRVCTWESVVIDRACDYAATAAPGAPIGARAELLRRIEPRIGPWQRTLIEDHAERTASLALALAERLGVAPAHLSRIRQIATLAPLGAAGIPEQILAKPEELTHDEHSVVRTHAETAGRIAQRLGLDEATAECVRLSHARFDAPADDGLNLGGPQPPDARIVALASAWASMASARPHRGPMTRSAIVKTLLAERGRQFAPEVVDAACRLINQSQDQGRQAA